MMKKIIGLALFVCGGVAGAYIGIWYMFVGGIVDVVRAVKMEDVDAVLIAFGILKVIFSSFVGWFSAIVLAFPGLALMQCDDK